MSGRDPHRLLRWYPPAWRERYGEDLLAYLEDEFGSGRPPLRARLSLLAGGARERARGFGLVGDSAPAPQRVRAGALVVLWAWTAFVVGGSAFAKGSEHFDSVLPPAGHRVPDLAYTLLQATSSSAAALVLAGALLAVPAVARYLRSGGWAALRGHVLRAAASTVATVAVAVPLSVWAHHLSAHDRNGGLPGYTVLFLTFGALFALTLGLWTATAVAAARRVSLTRTVFVAEAALAVAVAASMAVMVAATAVWWAAITSDQGSLVAAAGRGSAASPLQPVLALAAALMLVAASFGAAGVVRIVGSWGAADRGV